MKVNNLINSMTRRMQSALEMSDYAAVEMEQDEEK
jgi:hypothetical protein